MTKYINIIGIVTFFILGLFSLGFCEDITITTYYPSPYGSYNELTTTGNTYLATTSGNVGIGTMNPGGKLEVNIGNSNNFFSFNNDNNIGLELRSGTSGGTPYIDFSNDATSDYDMRLILRDNDSLAIEGGILQMGPAVYSDGLISAFTYGSPTYAIHGCGGTGATGIYGNTDAGIGVLGISSLSGTGVYGQSNTSNGVYGTTLGNVASGVLGESYGGSNGVAGLSNWGTGVYGNSGTGNGAVGISFTASGVYGQSTNGNGVYGLVNSAGASGVVGDNRSSGFGVAGLSVNGTGVYGRSDTGYSGYFEGGNGVFIARDLNILGGNLHIPYVGASSGDIYVGTRVFVGTSVVFSPGYAIYFTGGGLQINTNLGVSGDLNVSGTLTKGGGSFLIDHPLDPKNKVLRHSFVESPDMKNIYDGIIALDEGGQASVELPNYFTALNKDYRYQLTPVGAYAAVYIKQEIRENKFLIAGGYKGLKVSWQVTGIRKDAFAQKNPIVVEEIKGANNDFKKGEYLYPKVF